MEASTEQSTASTNHIPLSGPGTVAMEEIIHNAQSIEDLIPENIRKAMAEHEKNEAKTSGEVAPVKGASQQSSTNGEEPPPAEKTKGASEDEDEDSPITAAELKSILGEEEENKGDENSEGLPVWKTSDKYKAVIGKIGHTGLKDTDIDEVIQDAVDARVLEVSKKNTELDGLTKEAVKRNEKLLGEVNRLRLIEKGAFFDALDSTQTEFVKPLDSMKATVKDLLQFEGADISASKLLAAKDKASFTELVSDIGFSGDDLQKITNLWRSHRELNSKYLIAKKDASKDLSKHLSTALEDTQLTKVMRTALSDLISQDEYVDLKNGITEGIDKHKDVAEILTNAQTSFRNLGKVFGNPSDAVNDPDFLQGLAKWIINAHRNEHRAKLGAETAIKLKEAEILVRRLGKAYKKLEDSARGLEGRPRGNSSSNGSSAKGEESIEDLQKELNRILQTGEF